MGERNPSDEVRRATAGVRWHLPCPRRGPRVLSEDQRLVRFGQSDRAAHGLEIGPMVRRPMLEADPVAGLLATVPRQAHLGLADQQVVLP
jgi:hypothetical protein